MDAASRGESTHVSFDEFVYARGESLWRVAWLLAGDTHQAEDLVQVALMRCYKHYPRIGHENFESYVRRSIVNAFLSSRRRRWRNERPEEHLPENWVIGVDVDARADLVRALAALAAGQRAVIVLRYVEDLTERETAELLGCSIGTIKSQTARALRTLRVSPLLKGE